MPDTQSLLSRQSWRQVLPMHAAPRTHEFANMHAPPTGVVPAGKHAKIAGSPAAGEKRTHASPLGQSCS